MADESTPSEQTAAETPAAGDSAAATESPAKGGYKEMLAQYEQQQAEADAAPLEDEGNEDDAESDTKKPVEKLEKPKAKKPADKKAEDDKPEGGEHTLESLKDLVAAKKYDEALKALGAKRPERFTSKQWADFRMKTKAERDEIAADRQAVETERAGINSKVEEVNRYAKAVADRFAPYMQIEEALKDGDFESALELMGVNDIDDFATKFVKAKSDRDPVARRQAKELKRRQDEIERREAEYAERVRQEQEAAAARAAQQRAAQEEQQRVQAYLGTIQEDLEDSYPELMQRATEQKKVQNLLSALYNVQVNAYRGRGEQLTTEEALEEFLQAHTQWGVVLSDGSGLRRAGVQLAASNNSVSPDQDGSLPENLGQSRTVVSHQRAVSAGGRSAAPRSREQSRNHYANLLQQRLAHIG